MLGQIKKMWVWILNKFGLRKRHYHMICVADLPDKILKNKLYIVGSEEYPWCLAFICPCGCQDEIQLNTLEKVRPCWKAIRGEKGSTINPSINRKVGCSSHFFIRDGMVIWC
jgi:hypothetical protein